MSKSPKSRKTVEEPAPSFDKNELPAATDGGAAQATPADVTPQVEPRKDVPKATPEPVERETRAVRKAGGSDIEPDDLHRFPGRD